MAVLPMSIQIKPKLRNIEILPYESGGTEMLWLHDRMGIASDATVSRALAPLLSLFNGLRDVTQIIETYALRSGETLPDWFVENLVNQLDEACFLESPRYEAQRQHLEREFEAVPSRPAAHAGRSYPADPAALRRLLGDFFRHAKPLAASAEAKRDATSRTRGIVVPHIDFTRGGPVEALAYSQLQEPFDLVVVLGIAHNGVRYPFCVAPKDYETPLGTVQADKLFIEALQQRLGERLVAEQFAHKNEHSIEFVAVFMQYLENLRGARLVPILCGGFHSETRSQVSPSRNPDVAHFAAALRDTVRAWEDQGQRVGFIASVDLSHVGPNFDPSAPPVSPAQISSIETDDRAFLACVAVGDAEALHEHIARDDNARHVDAHPALYTLLLAFPELRARLLHYAYAPAPSDSIVSFASMTLYDTDITVQA